MQAPGRGGAFLSVWGAEKETFNTHKKRNVATYHVSISNWYVIELVVVKNFITTSPLTPPREYDEVVRSSYHVHRKRS